MLAGEFGTGAILLNGEIEKSGSASCWRRHGWEDIVVSIECARSVWVGR